jgi:hypothetical protein
MACRAGTANGRRHLQGVDEILLIAAIIAVIGLTLGLVAIGRARRNRSASRPKATKLQDPPDHSQP